MKIQRTAILPWCVPLAAAMLASPSHGQAPGIYSLGDLPGGTYSSAASGVSGDGLTVVGRSSSGTIQAVRWNYSTGLVGLDDLPGGAFSSHAFATSSNGSVIVGYGSTTVGLDNVRRAVRWVNGGAPESLGPLPGADRMTMAQATTPDGSVIVGYGRNIVDSEEAFRWTESGGMQALGTLPSVGGNAGSRAYGVSGDGQRVVGVSDNKAFQWTQAAGMVEIPAQAGASRTRSAAAVSASGDVVVGHSSRLFGGTEAFMWTPGGGTVGLGWLPLSGSSSNSQALAVNADGSLIVGTDNNRAFIWDSLHGIRHLPDALLTDYGIDTTGWALWAAEGISADGSVITGHGYDPQGRPIGWVVIIPAPGPTAILGLAALFASHRRRRETRSPAALPL